VHDDGLGSRQRAPHAKEVQSVHERAVERVRHPTPEPRAQPPAHLRRVEDPRIAGADGPREERRLAGARDAADDHGRARREEQRGVGGGVDAVGGGHAAPGWRRCLNGA